MARDKNPEANPAAVVLVQQPHGGALKQGGTIGPGRPSSKFRAKLQKGAMARYSDLSKIASGKMKGQTVADQLRAIEMMIKHGFGAGIPLEAVRERMLVTISWIESTFDEETADKINTFLRSVWGGVL